MMEALRGPWSGERLDRECAFAKREEAVASGGWNRRFWPRAGFLVASAPAEAPCSRKPEAYELYQQGRRHIQEFTEQSFSQSVVDFQNAIRLDPDYAAAYAGLADAYLYPSERWLSRKRP